MVHLELQQFRVYSSEVVLHVGVPLESARALGTLELLALAAVLPAVHPQRVKVFIDFIALSADHRGVSST
jgi:hypothetical protein